MSSNLWGVPIHPEIMECPPLEIKAKNTRARRDPKAMSIVSTIARILLGIQFGVLGINGFIMFLPAPRFIPHAAMTFAVTMATTHFAWFVFGAQVTAGLLVLFNRYLPLALVVLGAVIANIFAYHITMWPQAIFPMPIIALVLWFLTAWPIRSQFAPLFAQKVEAD